MTEAELVAWGRRIGSEVRRPVFIGLSGPLGAGKSVFARAVAGGAGVREASLPSPTFNLVFRYETGAGGVVIHADLYRLRSPGELAGIGWEDLLGEPGAVVLVEWPERAGARLPGERWEVRMGYSEDGEGRREVELRSFGDPPPLPGFPARML